MTVAGIARLEGEGAGRPAGGWWDHLRAGELLFARPGPVLSAGLSPWKLPLLY